MKTGEKYYPSITRDQFEKIRPILESARKQTNPRQFDLYVVFNAVLYLLKSGCQWRMLPKEYPKWRSVHEYFTIWHGTDVDYELSVLDQALKIGWRGPTVTGAERENELFNR